MLPGGNGLLCFGELSQNCREWGFQNLSMNVGQQTAHANRQSPHTTSSSRLSTNAQHSGDNRRTRPHRREPPLATLASQSAGASRRPDLGLLHRRPRQGGAPSAPPPPPRGRPSWSTPPPSTSSAAGNGRAARSFVGCSPRDPPRTSSKSGFLCLSGDLTPHRDAGSLD